MTRETRERECEAKAWELIKDYLEVHGLRYKAEWFDYVNVVQDLGSTTIRAWVEITNIHCYFDLEFTDEKIVLRFWNPDELELYHEEYNYKGEQIFFIITRKDGKVWKDNGKGLEDEGSWTNTLFYTQFASPIEAKDVLERADLFHERFEVEAV